MTNAERQKKYREKQLLLNRNEYLHIQSQYKKKQYIKKFKDDINDDEDEEDVKNDDEDEEDVKNDNEVEEIKEVKEPQITEEFILYTFLGVFVIYVVDSFARAGRYIR